MKRRNKSRRVSENSCVFSDFKRGFKKMYHGTNFDFDKPKPGIWLTENKRQAEAHGKYVKVFYIKPQNVVDLRKPSEREYEFNPLKGEPDFKLEHIKGFQESPSWQQITGKVYTEEDIRKLFKNKCK